MFHYLYDTNKIKTDARVTGIGKDQKGAYLLLDETVFYPQGGGQPSDQGTITSESETFPIHFAGFAEGEVRHYTASPILDALIGLSVFCEIDPTRRNLNARYHTAGHILADVVSGICISAHAVKGHQFPGEAYVEFINPSEDPLDAEDIQGRLKTWIRDGFPVKAYEITKKEYEEKHGVLPYLTTDDKTFRVIEIEPFPPRSLWRHTCGQYNAYWTYND